MATFIRDYATVLDEVESGDPPLVFERRAGRASFVLAPLSRTEGDRHAVSAVAAAIWSDPELARRFSIPVEVPHGADVPEPVGA